MGDGDSQNNKFGSVSFPVKKFQPYPGRTFLHWVALFDDLDDDGFDGQLGEDDYE